MFPGLSLIFRPMTHLELIVFYGVRLSSFSHTFTHLFQHHLLKGLSFLCWIALETLSKLSGPCVCRSGSKRVLPRHLCRPFTAAPRPWLRCFASGTLTSGSVGPPHASFPRWTFLFQILSTSRWILELTFDFLKKAGWGFDIDCLQPMD